MLLHQDTVSYKILCCRFSMGLPTYIIFSCELVHVCKCNCIHVLYNVLPFPLSINLGLYCMNGTIPLFCLHKYSEASEPLIKANEALKTKVSSTDLVCSHILSLFCSLSESLMNFHRYCQFHLSMSLFSSQRV